MINKKESVLWDTAATLFPYSCVYGKRDSETERQAKSALREFFVRLKKIKPDKETAARHGLPDYYLYTQHIAEAQLCLQNGEYASACSRILSSAVEDSIYQKRVYIALMRLNKQYLEG